MRSENDLSELILRGQLCEKGLLKESFNQELNDLSHELTEQGRNEVKKILTDKKYQKMFIQMALEEAGDPKLAGQLIRNALTRLK